MAPRYPIRDRIAISGVGTSDYARDNGKTLAGSALIACVNAIGDAGLRASDIDGIFGSTTKSATKNYQANYGLTADGIVCPQTWSEAYSWVIHESGGYYHYWGYDHNPKLYRFGDGEWFFDPVGDGYVNYYPTDHPSLDFGKC